MKRSYAIQLMLLGTGLISMTACNETSQNAQPIYSSVQECEQHTNDATQCSESFKQALTEHGKTAPTYMSMLECEEKFGVGNCVEHPNNSGSHHSGLFMPMMTGYMLGNLMRNTNPQPVYRDRYNNIMSKGNTVRGGFGNAATGRFASS